jgi:hypothetical protein
MAQAYARAEVSWGEYMAARKTLSGLTDTGSAPRLSPN